MVGRITAKSFFSSMELLCKFSMCCRKVLHIRAIVFCWRFTHRNTIQQKMCLMNDIVFYLWISAVTCLKEFSESDMVEKISMAAFEWEEGGDPIDFSFRIWEGVPWWACVGHSSLLVCQPVTLIEWLVALVYAVTQTTVCSCCINFLNFIPETFYLRKNSFEMLKMYDSHGLHFALNGDQNEKQYRQF